MERTDSLSTSLSRSQGERTSVKRAPIFAGNEGHATIGGHITIKGEILGSETLLIDGEVEGTISLSSNKVIIGPNAVVNANIFGRDVVILGTVKGTVTAHERVDIRREGSLTGDIVAGRISIEDGAYFKGGIDIRQRIVDQPRQAVDFTVEFVPSLSATTIHKTLSALADYYRACGGLGFELEFGVEQATVAQEVHA